MVCLESGLSWTERAEVLQKLDNSQSARDDLIYYRALPHALTDARRFRRPTLPFSTSASDHLLLVAMHALG